MWGVVTSFPYKLALWYVPSFTQRSSWWLGDLTNLIGCVLTDQLPFQVSLNSLRGWWTRRKRVTNVRHTWQPTSVSSISRSVSNTSTTYAPLPPRRIIIITSITHLYQLQQLHPHKPLHKRGVHRSPLLPIVLSKSSTLTPTPTAAHHHQRLFSQGIRENIHMDPHTLIHIHMDMDIDRNQPLSCLERI